MYGTVAHIRVKPGAKDAFTALLDEWNRGRGKQIEGNVGGYLYHLDDDPQNMIMVVIFKDRASYRANAEDPEQDRWFQQIAQHLEGEPVWHDGEITSFND